MSSVDINVSFGMDLGEQMKSAGRARHSLANGQPSFGEIWKERAAFRLSSDVITSEINFPLKVRILSIVKMNNKKGHRRAVAFEVLTLKYALIWVVIRWIPHRFYSPNLCFSDSICE